MTDDELAAIERMFPYVVRIHPDTVRDLLAEVRRLRTERDRLEAMIRDPSVIRHRTLVGIAMLHADAALRSAEREGRRTDCLREARRCLEGALDNVEYEDSQTEEQPR